VNSTPRDAQCCAERITGRRAWQTPENGHTMSLRQIGRGFFVSERKLKGLHEKYSVTGLYYFIIEILRIGESVEMHYCKGCGS
jgi:hypothetical protein